VEKNFQPPFFPDRRRLPSGVRSPAGGVSSCRGRAPGLGPPGKTMTRKVMVSDPDPRETGWSAPGPVWGGDAPVPQGREPLTTGDRHTLPIEGLGSPARQLDIYCWRETVSPSEGYIWNGYTQRWVPLSETSHDGMDIDRRIDSWAILREPASFEAGILLAAWEHLSQCATCRQRNQLTTAEVSATLAQLRAEWERVNQ
jgi:hypothetical protein